MKTFAKLVVGTVGVILSFGVIEAKMPRSASAASLYSITDLGTLGGTQSYARGINNSGQVVGYSYLAGDQTIHAFRTAPNSPINPATDDLGTLGGSSSYAYGINNSGQVVGSSYLAGNLATHAFRTAPNSPINSATDDLGTLGGFSSAAYAINDSGQVVGESDSKSLPHAFRTAPNSPINPATDDLDTIPNTASTAYGINNSGQVAVTGINFVAGSRGGRAFRTAPDRPIDPSTDSLGTLGGGSSYALGINNAGQVVGYSYRGNDQQANRAVLYDNRTVFDLGTLGGTTSLARAINNSGQIVGSSSTAGNLAKHAFLYDNGTLYDLNNLIAASSVGIFNSLTDAYGINDSGQIVGDGLIGNTVHAFLATPAVTKSVPEPSATPEELILGLGMVGGWVYRKRLAAKSLSSN